MKNKGVYRLLSGVLCTSVLLSSQVYAATPADYSDFPQNWSKDAMTFAVKNNYITGVSEDKIAPKAALTRAQLAAILSRVMKTGAGDVSVLDNFNDADKNAWYAGSMAKAVELNILYGDGDSIYPDRPVTRQELFTILVRAFSVTGGDESALAPYSDAGSVSSWARAAISAMIAQGYAAGYEDKTIRPTQQVTREEFAQLLYRMQEFYGSSDSSDNKTETKTDETTKTDGKTTSGGGGGGSSSGGGSHGGGSTVTANKIVDETKATVQSTDMGAWLPLAFKDGYSTENVTAVTVDDIDVTAKLSKVTTDGTIAKLPLVGTPKQVVIKSGDKTQTINLSGNGTASVYTGTQYLPDYVWAHGPIAAWDYYLTNYDEDGKVRVNPTRTTFSLAKEVSVHPYYSPDAEVKDSESFGHVDGNVTIMFNFNTDEEKAWFNGINKLELVEYNENKNTINHDLTFTPAKDVAHGSGKVGELTIPIDQSNFRNNGRYYVRVRSDGGDKKSVLVPIHVVNAEKPELLLRETVASGRNLHFDVKNMTYAITSPIESVTLTDPKGETKELRNLVDYALIGDLFVLYNDEKAEDGVNNIPYNGNYTITIRSNGFKEFSKSFTVEDGKDVSSKQAVAVQSSAYDVVTHATGSSSGGGSSDGGGSYMVSADLWFDSDLLANALLLKKMNVECVAAKKVIDNWYSVICDALINQGDTNYYTYTGYLNAVNDAKLAGAKWLGYAEYIAAGNAKTTPNRPYGMKEVLEDGLLGDIQHSDTYGRLEAPKATVGEAKEGQDVVITFANADAYMGNITKLYLNGDWKELSTDAYTINEADGTITIKAGTLKIGENKITVDATGYLSNVVTIDYAKETEKDLSLFVTTPISEGQDVVITVTNSKGDFLKYLSSVVLKNNDGTEKIVSPYGVEGDTAVYYVLNEDKTTITLKNVEPGTYTVSVSADYYATMTTEEFTVTRTTALAKAPSVKAHEKQTAGILDRTDYYRLSFDLTGKDLDTYLRAIKNVTVGDKKYEKEGFYFDEGNYRVKASDDTQSSTTYDVLDLAANGIDAVKGTLITVEAKGYEPMTYTLKGDSTPVTPDPDPNPDDGKLDAPEVEGITYRESDKYYEISFKNGTSDAVKEYLEKVAAGEDTVTVGTTKYTKSSTVYGTATFYCDTMLGWMNGYKLKLGDAAFTESTTKITIKVDGYKDLVFTYPLNSDNNGGNNGGETATTAPTGTVEKVNSYYQVSFTGDNVSDYIDAITSVKVGEVSYEYAQYESTPTGKQYVKGSVISPALKLGPDGFTGEGTITITITADGYAENTVTYTMPSSGSDKDDTETGEAAPKVNATLQYVAGDSWSVGYYRLTFDIDETDSVQRNAIETYLKAVTSVTVGNNACEEKTYKFSQSDKLKFYKNKEGTYGSVIYIDFTEDCFTEGETTEVIIVAEGYKTLKANVTYTK